MGMGCRSGCGARGGVAAPCSNKTTPAARIMRLRAQLLLGHGHPPYIVGTCSTTPQIKDIKGNDVFGYRKIGSTTDNKVRGSALRGVCALHTLFRRVCRMQWTVCCRSQS